MIAPPTLRVARPTDDVEALLPFYRDGLGLDVLYRFAEHDGFDGIMLGSTGAPYHFEFTKAHGHVAGRSPTQQHLLIFYLPAVEEWQAAVGRLEAAGFPAVPALNAYWDRQGRTFEDPDGYRVVIQNSAWTAWSPSALGRQEVGVWLLADVRACRGHTLRHCSSDSVEKREFLIVFRSRYPLDRLEFRS